jgi:membrane protease YdiL (CAAX protease family)
VPSGATGFAMAGLYGGALSVLRHLTGGLLLPWLVHVFGDLQRSR